MFSTTIGHHGFKNLHKYTLKQLSRVIGLDNFANKLAAIKVHNNQENEFLNIAKDYIGFSIIKEIGNSNLIENPHQSVDSYTPYMIGNYCSSISNTFTLFPLKGKYTLWVEDDCLIYSNGDINKYYEQAIEYLDRNPDIFSIHLNGGGCQDDSQNLFTNGKYAFRPHIFRTEQMFNVANFFKFNYNQLVNVHPELAYETIIKHLYPKAQFLEFNEKMVWHEHIGQSDFLEIKERLQLND